MLETKKCGIIDMENDLRKQEFKWMTEGTK